MACCDGVLYKYIEKKRGREREMKDCQREMG